MSGALLTRNWHSAQVVGIVLTVAFLALSVLYELDGYYEWEASIMRGAAAGTFGIVVVWRLLAALRRRSDGAY